MKVGSACLCAARCTQAEKEKLEVLNKDKSVLIFTGHYGSGKTEIAINVAIKLSKKAKTTLVDLDIVNPYFRLWEEKSNLEKHGLKVIGPSDGLEYSDLPLIPLGVSGALQEEKEITILDVGGDKAGAVALGRFKPYLKDNYEMYFVINTNRAGTRDKKSIIKILREIEASSRLKVSGLINNTHLLQYTTEDIILAGQELVIEVSEELNIPYEYTILEESLLQRHINLDKISSKIMTIKLYMKLPCSSPT